MTHLITLLSTNKFISIVIIFIFLDTILGVLRAIKERKFNSAIGINGAIRKVAMLSCIIILAIVDIIFSFNMSFMVPTSVLNATNITQIGICEFFCILFVLYEAISCMKNAMLCGLPMPKKLKSKLEQFLNEMTSEMPTQSDNNKSR
ncbi:phage holin family protein [Anaeromicropila herbilytica]|uniref:Protein UtxA n=1 Tax=Anaeromicropila herbilytica TaxID=2785025 RepID=A0A7R7EP49_9FIRM|nr:phage holin family protein [Anaeromicropila herbilytica]BCN32057.1 protein UtxA [Anaeromicropila herbilytica]